MLKAEVEASFDHSRTSVYTGTSLQGEIRRNRAT